MASTTSDRSHSSIQPTHLILVCCHAHFSPSNTEPLLESSWHLKPFQRTQIYSPGHPKQSEHLTFCHHILAGHSLSHRSSLLIFSGGPTDPLLPSTSEAETYLSALRALSPSTVNDDDPRIATEEQATDSYQNLLFSLLLFRRHTSHWPERISIVTHAFKAPRFLRCHVPAIRWPVEKVEVIGIDPVWACEEEKTATLKGEEGSAFEAFRGDPYGIGPALGGKREARRWDSSVLEGLAEGMEEEVKRLIMWDRMEMFDGPLPWATERVDAYSEDGELVMESVELESKHCVTKAPCTRTTIKRSSKNNVSS